MPRHRSRSRSPRRSSRRDRRSRSRSRDRRRRSRSRSRDRRPYKSGADRRYEHNAHLKDSRGHYRKNDKESKCIGVFGLDWDTTERELERKFSKYGEITGCTLIWDNQRNHSRGFGFVTFSTVDAAAEAVEAMNGRTIEGRTVRVDFSYTKNYDAKRPGAPEDRQDSRSPPRRTKRERSESRSDSRSRSYSRSRSRSRS